MEILFSPQMFEKYSNIKFLIFHRVESELLQTEILTRRSKQSKFESLQTRLIL
jgi:hypothetical protein